MIPNLEKDYYFFIRAIKKEFGLSLHLYKETQMKRRILSFLTKKGFQTFGEFFNQLKHNSQLLDDFISLITINVSAFFRNRQKWLQLEEAIIPKLAEETRGRIKIWSAACSSGEEPYTLSILMNRCMNRQNYEIVATDIEPAILKRAVIGRYSPRQLEELTLEEREQYFDKHPDGTYEILKQYRQAIRFKRHDLLNDEYEKHVDLIVCRNVLIYFTAEGKDAIYRGFAASLRKGGILFLGGSEQILNPASYGFALLENFFYIKL